MGPLSPAAGAFYDRRCVMQAVHAFVTAFAKAVGGVLFKLAAFGAFNPWDAICEAILSYITCLTKSSGAGEFQLAAIGARYLFRPATDLISFLITFLAKPFRINGLHFSAADTFGKFIYFILFPNHILCSRHHFTKMASLCQYFLNIFVWGTCHAN